MRISVFGAGHVGLVAAACFAEMGNDVICCDVDRKLIVTLKHGEVRIHEAGLRELISRNVSAGRLSFTDATADAVAHAKICVLAVDVPLDCQSRAILSNLIQSVKSICQLARTDKIIVVRSTVPVGTCDQLSRLVGIELSLLGSLHRIIVGSNPEFSKEGSAIADFFRPDRVVVGARDSEFIRILRELYAPFLRRRDRMITMDPGSAELTKLAANAMLATRVSFMNEMADLAEKVGADIEHVRAGVGTDSRIGAQYLYAGAGYGGSCIPKDVRMLAQMGSDCGAPTAIVRAVDGVNTGRKHVIASKLLDAFGSDLKGKRIAVWGFAFKPDTEDTRGSPAIQVIEELLMQGATVNAYDPVATLTLCLSLKNERAVRVARSATGALTKADALVVMTEWKEFRAPDFEKLRRTLRARIVLDARNIYDPAVVRAHGLKYFGVGRL
jgi:UDPglucose 6-dehydrogenase